MPPDQNTEALMVATNGQMVVDGARMPVARDAVLRAHDLSITVPHASGRATAVRAASFVVAAGEAVGFVGESGSGKTLTCRAVLGALPPGCEVSSGSLYLDGADVSGFAERDWREAYGSRIAAVFQDPGSYLNPSLSVGRQLAEVLRVRAHMSRPAARRRAIELLSQMGLRHPDRVYHQIPAELSGGMLQRVMIAIAVSCDPEVLIADEATTALDVTTQAEVVELLARLKRELGLALVFVSHDLAVVADVCDRVVIFYAGEVVEVGPMATVAGTPLHPYSEALLRVGSMASDDAGHLAVIPGQPPSVGEESTGCRFASRCDYATDLCRTDTIPLREVAPDRLVRCVRVAGANQ
jgi:peptide/nickel transport system ATP-binding protein